MTQIYQDMRGKQQKGKRAFKFKLEKTKEKVWGKLDKTKNVFNTTHGWQIQVNLNKMKDKKEKRRIKKEFEEAKLKSPKEVYHGYYDRENQTFYVYKITYPHAMIKPENLNFNVYSIKIKYENGPDDIIEGDYIEDKADKGVLKVNDDFEIHIISDKIPQDIKKKKANAVFSGPIENPTETFDGYYTEDDAQNIKFYVLSKNLISHKEQKRDWDKKDDY